MDESRTIHQAAERLGVSDATIQRAARRYGIASSHRRKKRPELHDDGTWLRAQFHAGRSIAEVAAALGVNYGTVVTARRRLGVSPSRQPRRTIDVDEVRRRLDAGESLSAIGRALGHTSSLRALRHKVSHH